MGSSQSRLVLYFENSQQNKDEICDEMCLDLPNMFKKTKLIFEPIYQKHGFHKCILVLEYKKKENYIEYENEIVKKDELFKFSDEAYIKIKNKGNCICPLNDIFLNEELSEIIKSKKQVERSKIIEEFNNYFFEEKKKRENIENELQKERENTIKNLKISQLLEEKLESKVDRLEKEINLIKSQNDFVNDTICEIFDVNDNKNYYNQNSYRPSYSSRAIINNCFLKDCNNEYKRSIDIYEQNVIFPTIKGLINDTYSNFLNNLRYKDFQKDIFNFLDFQNMYYSIKKKLEKDLNKICQNITKTKHLNIVLLGREGVGKSTLLNTVLKLEGEKMAKTGVGDSVTLEIKKYTNPESNLSFLRLYDTQGIGIKEENKAEKIFSDIKKLIEQQIIKKDSNPDDLIHCLWFCFNERFGDLEIEILKQLSETYSDKTLPTIIVHTKTFSQSLAKKSIKEIMSKYKISKENICQVLAQDEDENEESDVNEDEAENNEPKKKSFGINELMQKTINKIEDAVESANYQFTKYHIFIEIDKYLDEISNEKTINFKDKFYKELSFEGLEQQLSKILFNKSESLIESITNQKLNKKTELLSSFELFLNDTILKSRSLFNDMIDEISKKHSPEIGKMIFDQENKDKKGKKNDSQNEKYFMYNYQKNIKNEEYPFRKSIEKKVIKYISKQLIKRVMEYFRLAIKQTFTTYAREKDKDIMDLYKKFSQESIKFASEEIKKKIEFLFPSKKKNFIKKK